MEEGKDVKKQLSKKQIITMSGIALVVVAAVGLVLLMRNQQIRATTMRLLRMEGTVHLEENGVSKTVKETLRLKSGNALDTEAMSLVSIGLDDTKIVTMNEISRAEFEKKGKKLDLNLTQGSLYFEVTEKLKEDETFEIRTSTMVVGIRGTSGYVSTDENGHEYVLITDGMVHVIGRNPVTGEVKEIDVPAGSRIIVYLYNDREKDSIMFSLEPTEEEEVPKFVVARVKENEELLARVVEDTGWDVERLGKSKPAETMEAEVLEITEETVALEEELAVEESNEEEEERLEEEPKPEEESEVAEEILPEGVTKNPDGTYTLPDGTIFDPVYYAANNPDVVNELGTDPVTLLNHYLTNNETDNRAPNQQVADQRAEEEAKKKAEEEAARKAQESTNNNNDSGSDNSASNTTNNNDPSNDPNNDPNNNNNNNTTNTGYTLNDSNQLVDEAGNVMATIDTTDHQVTINSGTYTFPLEANGEEYAFSSAGISDVEAGTTFQVGSTAIQRTGDGWLIGDTVVTGYSGQNDTTSYHEFYDIPTNLVYTVDDGGNVTTRPMS